MKQDELRKAISDAIIDALFRMFIYYTVGALAIVFWRYLYGFMKGLLG